MATEWRSNLWLCIQLIIVGLVLWFFSWQLVDIRDTYSSDNAFDYHNVYYGSIKYINESSSAFVQQPEGHTDADDLNLIISTLRANPYVEEAGYGINALPYNFTYYGGACMLPGDTVTPYYSFNARWMTPEMLRVLRIEGVDGESTEDLVRLLQNHKVIISRNEKIKDISESYRGKDAIHTADSSNVLSIGAIIKPFRRNDFEPQRAGNVIMLLDYPANGFPSNIAMRVKEGVSPQQFLESLKPSDLHVGNVLVYDITSLEATRRSAQHSYWDKVRTAVSGSVFLLVIVFLGFIGTFWFRTRQRRSEIAIRKVNGATDGNIYRRLFSEGLTILLVAAIIDLPLAYLAIGKLNIGQELNRQMCWPSFALSVLLMAVMILVGVWFPARNAMKIQPSDALHDE